MGLDEIAESEGLDRSNMRLAQNQVDLLQAVAAVNSKIVVVLYSGSVVETPWLDSTEMVGKLILKINSIPADKRASFSPEEIRLMRTTVNRLRNEKLAKGQYTDATDDVLLKLI